MGSYRSGAGAVEVKTREDLGDLLCRHGNRYIHEHQRCFYLCRDNRYVDP